MKKTQFEPVYYPDDEYFKDTKLPLSELLIRGWMFFAAGIAAIILGICFFDTCSHVLPLPIRSLLP
jgi:hypothetical protein